MKPIRPFLLSVVLAALAMAGMQGCAGNGGSDTLPGPVPLRTARPDADLAVACLVWGEVTPPLGELSEARLHEVVDLLGHLLSSYGRADFDAFLALREGDLERATCSGRHDRSDSSDPVDELHVLARQLGVEERDLPPTWLEALRVFWEAYYDTPPVRRWVPDETVLRLSDTSSSRRRELSFDALSSSLEGTRIEHRLVVPVVVEPNEERPSLDLRLGFETAQGRRGLLVAQFVARPGGRGWSLVRAVTAMDPGSPPSSPSRQLIL